MQYKMSLKYLLIIFFIALASWYFKSPLESVEPIQETTAASKMTKDDSNLVLRDKSKTSANASQSLPVEAQTFKKIRAPKLKPEVSFRSIATQELRQHQISRLGSNWQWVVNLSAVPKHLYKGSLRDSFGEANNHILYENRVNVSSPDAFFSENPLVLYNQNRQKYGLLTGIFITTAKSAEDFKKILEDPNFEVVNSFQNLRLVFLKPVQSPFNFNEYALVLSADQRVSQVEYEILNMNWVKN